MPSTRPVSDSTSRTGVPPEDRMSARSLARRRSVQNQPCGRRRSRPPSVSASTAVRAPGPKMRQVGHGQRRLRGGGAQMRPEHVGVVGVEDVGLDGLAEQHLGVVDQVGVQRVVARHHHAERVASPPPGAAHLLPQRRPCAGESGQQYGVEAADVDAELECVGRGQSEQPPGAQRLLELAAFLGQVATAIGGDLVDQAGVHLAQQPARGRRHDLGPAPRTDERQGVHALDDEVGEQVRDLAGGGRVGPAHRSRRCPARTAAPRGPAPCVPSENRRR